MYQLSQYFIHNPYIAVLYGVQTANIEYDWHQTFQIGITWACYEYQLALNSRIKEHNVHLLVYVCLVQYFNHFILIMGATHATSLMQVWYTILIYIRAAQGSPNVWLFYHSHDMHHITKNDIA